MTTEIDSLNKNQIWELVPRPYGKNFMKFRWVYRTKFTFDNVVEQHNARLVAKGFSQQEGIDYTKIFSLIAKMNFVHMIISLASRFG